MSEKGDKARKALHDMRWGPHIPDVIERQERMDAAIKVALQAISSLEAKLEAMEELQIEVENVIGMAHSFANFPSWLEQLEKALAQRDRRQIPEDYDPERTRELAPGIFLEIPDDPRWKWESKP